MLYCYATLCLDRERERESRGQLTPPLDQHHFLRLEAVSAEAVNAAELIVLNCTLKRMAALRSA